MISAGSIGPETLVWRDGMKDWLPLSTVPELGGQMSGPYPHHEAPAPVYNGGPEAPSSGLAIASMVCGIVGYLTCYFVAILGIPAVICGHMALSQIKNSPVPMGGRGMAIAGLVLGYLGIAITLGLIIFFGIAIATGKP